MPGNGWLWVDPWPRVDFYVQHGLVSRRPTPEQLARASRENFYGAGVVERLRYFARHPLELLPWWKRPLAPNAMVQAGVRFAEPEDPARGAPDTQLDRFLASAFRVSVVRFGVQTLFNPWNPVPGTGLRVPTRFLISHLVHAPHPSALWDLQVIHPDPGSLDALEREIDRVVSGHTLRARTFRAMANRPGYHDYLRDLVARVRRFDYPPTPRGFNPTLENLVNFLNHASEL
jgi:hypothetical protein